jgi:phage-related protein
MPTLAGLGVEIRRQVQQNERDAPHLGLTAELRTELLKEQLRIAAREGDQTAIRLLAELDAAEAETRFQALKRQLSQKITLKVALEQTGQAVRGLRELDDGVTNLGTSLARTTGAVGAQTLKYAALAGAATGAANEVIGLGSAAITASGSLLTIPAAGLTAAAILATVKTGLSGFGDALKETDPAKFAEDLAKMSPAARDTAVQIRALAPALTALRLDVQQQLFAGLSTEVDALGQRYVPVLRTGLAGIAGELNTTAHGLAAFLDQAGFAGDLSTIFDNARQAVANLGSALGPLLSIFRNVATVGSGFLPALTAGVGALALKWAEFIGQARESGRLAGWMQAGIDAARQFGTLLGNFVSIVASVFRAISGGGTGTLSVLVSITDKIDQFVRSASGIRALQQIFGGLSAVAAGLNPLFDALGRVLVTQIAPAVAKLGPQLGASIASLAGGFEPLAGILVALSPLLSTAAQATAQVLVPALRAVQPVVAALVGPVQRVVQLLGSQLSQAITSQLAPALLKLANAAGPLIEKFGTLLVNALTITVGWFAQLADEGSDLAASFGGALLDVLGSALKAFGALASTGATVLLATLRALQPSLPAITSSIAQLAQVISANLAAATPTLIKVGQLLAQAVDTVVIGLLPSLPQLADSLLRLVVAAIGLVPPLLQLASAVLPGLIKIVTALLPVIEQVADLLAEVITDATPLVQFLADTLSPQIEAFGNVVGDVFAAVAAIVAGTLQSVRGVIEFTLGVLTLDWDKAWRGLGDIAQGDMRAISGVINSGADIVLQAVKSLGSSIVSTARLFLNDALVAPGKALIDGLIRGIESKFQQVKDLLAALTNMIGKWKGPPEVDRKLLTPNGKLIMQGLLVGLEDGTPAVRSYLTRLTADLPTTLPTVGAGTPPASALLRPVTINVYPQPGQSEAEIAAMVDRRLTFAGRL